MGMFEITLQGTYQNQQIINRLNFVSDNEAPATANALGLVRGLGYTPVLPTAPASNSFLDRFLEAQTEVYRLELIVARNLFVPTDYYTVSLSGSGWLGVNVVGADAQLSFIANKLQTNRIRSDIRRGSLALTPLSEEAYSADGTLTAPSLATLQAVCDALNEPPSFTESAVVTNFVPAVLKKEEYVVPNRTDGRTAYRYYADPAEQLANAAIGVTWQPKPRATSQVSRRIGKGA